MFGKIKISWKVYREVGRYGGNMDKNKTKTRATATMGRLKLTELVTEIKH